MTFVLFVGDVTPEVCNAAINHDKNAQLLLANDVTNLSADTYYTSLADCGGITELGSVCAQADEIYYILPNRWSDADKNNKSDQQKWTEFVLRYYKQTKPVYNLTDVTINSWLHSNRKHKKQFWTVGCSITAGTGVEDDQSWPALVSKELNLPYTNLSYPGASIIWQSDQICRSDIQAGDIVFWGVTANQRLPIMQSNEHVFHLTVSKFQTHPTITKNLPLELIDNDTLVYQNILAVRRAYNYCQKIGAYLVPIGLVEDLNNIYTRYDVPVFYQLIQWKINPYIDLGSDCKHPGPEQHKLFAREFLSHYKKVYNQI